MNKVKIAAKLKKIVMFIPIISFFVAIIVMTSAQQALAATK